MKYFKALYDFTIGLVPLTEIDFTYPELIFHGASFLSSLFVVVLDIQIFKLFRKSLLGLRYNKRSSYLSIVIAWTVAGLITSLLGRAINMFGPTIQSCVLVGFAWMRLISSVLKELSKPNVEQNGSD